MPAGTGRIGVGSGVGVADRLERDGEFYAQRVCELAVVEEEIRAFGGVDPHDGLDLGGSDSGDRAEQAKGQSQADLLAGGPALDLSGPADVHGIDIGVRQGQDGIGRSRCADSKLPGCGDS